MTAASVAPPVQTASISHGGVVLLASVMPVMAIIALVPVLPLLLQEFAETSSSALAGAAALFLARSGQVAEPA